MRQRGGRQAGHHPTDGRPASGLSILEVVIGAGLLLLVGMVLLFVVGLGLQQLTRAKALARASSLAQQKMEEVIQQAPGQLSSLTGSFSGEPTYQYAVSYAPHPTLPAVQTALVEVTGPFQTRTAYAQVVPAGGFTKPVGGFASAGPSTPSVPYTAVLGKSTNTLNVSLFYAATPLRYQLLLGSSRVIASLTAASSTVTSQPGAGFTLVTATRSFVTFLDQSTTPPSVCSLSIWFSVDGSGNITFLGGGNGSQFGIGPQGVLPDTPTAVTPACSPVVP